jgi:cytochrome c5
LRLGFYHAPCGRRFTGHGNADIILALLKHRDIAMSEHDQTEHSSPIKTPKQLAIAIVLAFIVPVVVIIMLAQLAVDTRKPTLSPDAHEEAVAKRLKPVGEVVVAAAGGAQQVRDGKSVFDMACAACHSTGAMNAPKIGDKAVWGKLTGRSLESLTTSAIKGVRQMPARGGNPDLTDVEVARAIVYMANQSGSNWKEPAAPAAPAAAPANAASAPAVVAAATADSGNDAKGKSIYESSCAACHVAGVAGAPKPGDKAAWAPRLKTGKDALYASVIKGKNAMPPKGGNASLSDADIKAAVDYLMGLAK